MRKVILLTALVFIVSVGFSKSQTKNKQRGQVQFSELIKKIETKFDVSITYETDISFDLTKKQVTEVIKKETVEEALTETLKTKNISFKKIRDDYYVLSKKKKDETSENFKHKQLQERVVTGTVTDDAGEPIPGVTVVAKEAQLYVAMTDFEGKFSITINENVKHLVFTYIGFLNTEVNVEGKDDITVILKEDLFNIDEVIVSGVAGNTLTKKLTVSVQKISEDELKDVPASSAAGVLFGKVAGLTMTEANGSPGSGYSLRLRGSTSLTGAQAPLIIMDGIMVQTNLADINVDDIASIEVVKGAAAASLYGSKAGNGVIIITTKRGKDIKNSFQVKVRNEYGITQLTKELDLATHHPHRLADDNDDYPYTRYEGITYDDEGNIVGGGRLTTDNAYADQPYSNVYNHQSEFFKQGEFYTNYVSLSKKSNETNMFMSFENNKNTGILFSTDGYNRKNFRFNADTKIGKRITISTSNLYVNTVTDNPGTTSGFSDALFISPDADLMADNEDGTPYLVKPDIYSSLTENPLYPLYYRTDSSTRSSFMTNFKLKVDITDWLDFDTKYTYEKLNKYNWAINPKGYLYQDGNYISGHLTESNTYINAKTFQTTLNLNKIVSDFTIKSKLSFLYEYEYGYYSWKKGEGLDFADVPHFNNVDQSTVEATSKILNEEVALNFFGIFDIDYKDKYMLSLLFREDGSSTFGSEERWNPYYRIAGAYRLSEDFNLSAIDELKLRAAIGTAGQRPGYSWQYTTFYTSGGNTSNGQLGNKYLKPSETREIEFAIDAVLKNKISLTASYSMADTKGAFLKMPIAVHIIDFPSQWRNAADIKTNAFELVLKYNALNKKSTNLDFTLSFDKIHQEVSDIEGGVYRTGPNDAFVFAPGEIIGTIYGLTHLTSLDEMENQLPDGMTINDYEINSDGYVIEAGTEGTVDERPIIYDEGNDGTVDKVVIGDSNPDFNMNFGTTFTYKNLSFYMLWSWKHRGNIYNYTKQFLMRDGLAADVDQSNVPDGNKKSFFYYEAFYTNMYNGIYHTNDFNSHFVEDGSFVKLREVSLYYNLKFKNSLAKHIKNVKIGIIGRNMLTFTNYSGFDPEVSSGSDLTNYSFDNFGYPIFRSFTGSIEFTF